jgi:hypothetical protein
MSLRKSVDRKSVDINEDFKPLPQWLTNLFPELNTIGEIEALSSEIINELEVAHQKMKKDQQDIEEMAIAAQASGQQPPITWSNQLARSNFASKYCKNFRLRITMRQHELYQDSRAPKKTLNSSFEIRTRNCPMHLQDQTWEGFYNDIDEALSVTHTNIDRELIVNSITGSSEARTAAVETINIKLIAAVIYLRLVGYSLYPDLTL